MKLNMCIDNIIIARWDINTKELCSVMERQEYLERKSVEMYWNYYNEISTLKKEPIFFIEIPSKMDQI